MAALTDVGDGVCYYGIGSCTASANPDDHSESHKSALLPLSRVKLIMKSSPGVSCIGLDALYVMAKSTEMFVQSMAQHSLLEGGNGDVENLSYRNLAHLVQHNKSFQFLADVVPRKILASEYMEMMEQEKRMLDEEG
uniref:chromatin accessibility complex protein 1 n=1 Tax=Myxine glutinosa TaxID=7769 RepID=UPI00358E1779